MAAAVDVTRGRGKSKKEKGKSKIEALAEIPLRGQEKVTR
jgi:hypothetical protein